MGSVSHVLAFEGFLKAFFKGFPVLSLKAFLREADRVNYGSFSFAPF